MFGMTHPPVWGEGGLRSSVRGEVRLARSHVRGRPILPAAPKLLPIYLQKGHQHQGFTGARHWEHGGSSQPFRKLRPRLRGGSRRGCTGLTGLISTYAFGMTHTPVWEGGNSVQLCGGRFGWCVHMCGGAPFYRQRRSYYWFTCSGDTSVKASLG